MMQSMHAGVAGHWRVAGPGFRRSAVALAVACAAALLLLAAPRAAATEPRAQAAAVGVCPFTFQVLHNDRIGPAVLPKGHYQIKLLVPSGISCQGASKLFARFLQDYDGKLPKPWKVVAKAKGTAVFTRSGRATFRVKRGAKPGGGGGGGGGGHGTKGTVCPGTFRVLHNDRIGPLRFPKGRYRLIIPPGSIITCTVAAKLFRQFLNRPKGNLPKNWHLKRSTAVFYKPGNAKRKKFRVDPGL